MWFSHGHPDHLNPDSVEQFRGRKILVADHVGGRIARELAARGFDVDILPDRRWVDLSPRIRVMCIADYIQDSVLLVDVAGTLFVDLNDCRARGSAKLIRRIASGYPRSYMLKLTGHGDADMINFFDEDGNRLPYVGNPMTVGAQLSDLALNFGTTHVVPFSSFHQYQRADSVWVNRYTTRIADYPAGFDERIAEYVQPFVAIDAETGAVTPLEPSAIPARVRPSEDFGDSWSDELEKSDEAVVARYFQRKGACRSTSGFFAWWWADRRSRFRSPDRPTRAFPSKSHAAA